MALVGTHLGSFFLASEGHVGLVGTHLGSFFLASEGILDAWLFSAPAPPRLPPSSVVKRSGYSSRSEGACSRIVFTSMPNALITCPQIGRAHV